MSPQLITPFLEAQGFCLLDGGLATELEAMGWSLDNPLWSAHLLDKHPDVIRAAHYRYLEAGADIIATATYQATFAGFQAQGFSTTDIEKLLLRSVELAAEARADFWRSPARRHSRQFPLIAASIGPYGAYLANGAEYTGHYKLSPNELHHFHQTRFSLLAQSPADLLAFETIPKLEEAKVLCQLLKAHPNTNAWLSFSCRDETHIAEGLSFQDTLVELPFNDQLVALGFNCCTPQWSQNLISVLAQHSPYPIVVYPNSGEGWNAAEHCWIPADQAHHFDKLALQWHKAGAQLIGACCRSRPADIRAMRAVLTEYQG